LPLHPLELIALMIIWVAHLSIPCSATPIRDMILDARCDVLRHQSANRTNAWSSTEWECAKQTPVALYEAEYSRPQASVLFLEEPCRIS
jgi:hypothetical protein